MEDLLQVIGEDAASIPGYCNTDLRSEGPYYWDWEDQVAIPLLRNKGYTVVCVLDGERDSFGPLSRVLVVERNGQRSKLIYG